MAQINIRIDDNLKEQGEKLFSSLGMSFSSAVSIFVSQSIREGGLPFMVTTKTDPFYSDSNMKVLRAARDDMEAGRGIITKTIKELEDMEKC